MMNLLESRNSKGESLMEYTLTTRVMSVVCVAGFILTYLINVEDYLSMMIFIVVPFSVVVWLGVYSDVIHLICARVLRSDGDTHYYKLALYVDAGLLLASVPFVLRLPEDGFRYYCFLMVPVGLPVLLLSIRKLYTAIWCGDQV